MLKKRLLIVIGCLIGLIIASISIKYAFDHLVDQTKWIGLAIGVIFMLAGILAMILAKYLPILYLLSFVLNMIGVGLSITAYYVLKAYSLELVDFAVAIAVSIGVLAGFSALSVIPIFKKHHKLFASIVIIISFLSSLTLWLSVDKFTGLSFYFLNVTYFFIVTIIRSTDSLDDVARELAVASIGAFILISIIVFIILSEGESLSLDLPVGSRKKKKG